MSKSTRRRPVRTILWAVLAAFVVLGFRAAVADKGGSYDPTSSRA